MTMGNSVPRSVVVGSNKALNMFCQAGGDPAEGSLLPCRIVCLIVSKMPIPSLLHHTIRLKCCQERSLDVVSTHVGIRVTILTVDIPTLRRRRLGPTRGWWGWCLRWQPSNRGGRFDERACIFRDAAMKLVLSIPEIQNSYFFYKTLTFF
jgi:hypothetical protein